MSNSQDIHVAVALDGAGWDPFACLGFAREAEAAGVSFVTLEDAHSSRSARLDAPMLAAWLATRTAAIGLIPAADTATSEPYLLSAQIATLDFVSHGRAGWLLQVSGQPSDAGYVGPRPVATGEDAVSEAAEYLEIVRRLWDSWEDDAEIRDGERHRFFDRDRVHHIDFHGRHLSVKGPSITPRPPQGQPVIATAVEASADDARLELAVGADLVFIRADGASGLDRLAGRVRAAARRGSEPLLFADFALPASGQITEPAALAARLDLNGVRLWPSEGATLDLGPLVRGGGVTLRERLGLSRPQNRYAAPAEVPG